MLSPSPVILSPLMLKFHALLAFTIVAESCRKIFLKPITSIFFTYASFCSFSSSLFVISAENPFSEENSCLTFSFPRLLIDSCLAELFSFSLSLWLSVFGILMPPSSKISSGLFITTITLTASWLSNA